MVRNVKNEGMSFVEILVSMVILSIVVLVMTNVLVTSTRSHSSASSEDAGDMLALEKLAELQNHVIPAKNGDDIVNKDNTEYTRKWTITGDNPPRVEVMVKWDDLGGNPQDASVIGYIDSDNNCPTINLTSPSGPPTNMQFVIKNNSGIDEAVPDNRLNSSSAIDAHTPIVRVSVTDPNIDYSGTTPVIEDILSYEITSLNADSMFYLKNDTLYNAKNIGVNTSHTIDVKVTDCEGHSTTGTFEIWIDGSDYKIFPKNFEIKENTTTADLGSVFASHATETWQLLQPSNMDIEFINGETFTKLKVDAGFDYETEDTVEVKLKAKKSLSSTDEDTKSCYVIVLDVPEPPTELKLKLDTSTVADLAVDNDAIGTKLIDVIEVVDLDKGAQTYIDALEIYHADDPTTPISPKFLQLIPDGEREFKIKPTSKNDLFDASENWDCDKLFQVKITITDNDVTPVSDAVITKTFSLKLNKEVWDCSKTTDYVPQVGSPTGGFLYGHRVDDGSDVYRCIVASTPNNKPLPNSDWIKEGKCKN